LTLDERKRQILESIVKDYVETAEPVGSRAVVKKYALNISSATVRNEMADLEDMGYLEQPHTSSGRIPSERGFRYYVDYIMEKQQLSNEEIEMLDQLVDDNEHELSQFIGRIGYFLSQVTNYASFVVVPSVKLKNSEPPIDSSGKRKGFNSFGNRYGYDYSQKNRCSSFR
jgi:heat-inducible transcriptional repressor